MIIRMLGLMLLSLVLSCDKDDMMDEPSTDDDMEMDEINADDDTDDDGTFVLADDSQAAIQKVEVSGSEERYNFNVEISSPDTGCDQYADWWEVFTLDSTLIYRRILAHSHVNEQPFSRSGGPIDISKDDQVIIRGHMNNLGYGSLVMRGSVEQGFVMDTLSIDYAHRLESTEPLPQDCDF